MKAFLKVVLTALYTFTSCKASECNCHAGELLEDLTQIFEFRNAWDFLTTEEELYLIYLPHWVDRKGKQCIASRLESPPAQFPIVHRSILYTDSLIGDKRQSRSVTLTMDTNGYSKTTYFTTDDFPTLGSKFPIVYFDSKCLIYQMTKNIYGGRTRMCFLGEKKRQGQFAHSLQIYLRFLLAE
uniref:Putative salivary protein n=1 Tax=Ixodes ricinus TaxID=34613 RepID=A0A090XEC7_IXORI